MHKNDMFGAWPKQALACPCPSREILSVLETEVGGQQQKLHLWAPLAK
jgi:hypothetical protein